MFLPTLSYIFGVGYPLPHIFLNFFLQILENSSTSFEVSHLLKGHTMFFTIRNLLRLESNYKFKIKEVGVDPDEYQYCLA